MSNTCRGKDMVGVILSKKKIRNYKTTTWYFILFENLFKPRQIRFTVGMVTDFVSSIHNLKAVL